MESPETETAIARCMACLGGVTLSLAAVWPSTSDPESSGLHVLVGCFVLSATGVGLFFLQRWPRQHVLPLLATYVLWSYVCHLYGIARFHSGQSLAVLLAGSGATLALVIASIDSSAIRAALHSFVLVLCGTSVTSLLTLGLTRVDEPLHCLTGCFINADSFGCILMLGFSVSLELMQSAGRVERRYLTGVGTILVLTLCLTGSTAAIVASVAVCAISLWRAWGQRDQLMVQATVLSCLGGILALSILSCSGQFRLLPRLRSAMIGTAKLKANVRGIVWDGLLQTWSRSPVMGFGPDSFAQAFQQDRPHGKFAGYIDQADNLPVQVLVDTGTVGLILFLMIWLIGYKSGGGQGSPFLGGLGVFSLMGSWQSVGGLALPGFGLLGGALGQGARWRPVRALRIAICTGILLGGWRGVQSGWATWRVQDLCRQAQEEGQNGLFAEAWKLVCRATSVEPYNERLWLMRGQFAEGMRVGCSPAPWLSLEIRRDVERALQCNRGGVNVRFLGAHLLASLGDVRTAEALYDAQTCGYPEDWRSWQALARIYAIQGRLGAAYLAYLHAVSNNSDCITEVATIASKLAIARAPAAAILCDWIRSRLLTAEVGRQLAVCTVNRSIDVLPEAAADFCPVLWSTAGESPQALLALARISLRNGGRSQCERLLEQAWQGQSNTDADDWLARREAFELLVMLNARHRWRACHLFQAFLERYPGDTEMRVRLARLLTSLCSWDKAEDTWREAIRRDPTSGVLHADLGDTYAQQGLYSLAVFELETAMLLAPRHTDWPLRIKWYKRLVKIQRLAKAWPVGQDLLGRPAIQMRP